MTRNSLSRLLLGTLAGVILAAPATFALQSVAVATGASAQSLNITIQDANGASQVVLSDVEFQDFDLAGRVVLDALDASRPQRIAVPGSPTFIQLPGGARIFSYKRQGGTTFGYLLINAAGAASVLLEAAAGAGGASPYAPVVACSPDGAWLAAPGGAGLSDLHLVNVATAQVTELGLNNNIDITSLTFANGALFLTLNKEFVRRISLPGGIITNIALPLSAGAVPGFVAPELAVSRDGSTVAALAGDSNKKTDLYIIKSDGTVWNRTKNPAKHEFPGYEPLKEAAVGEPDVPGPVLSLNEDGSQVAYLRKLDGRELFIADTASTATGLGVQQTGDANFVNTIGTGVTIGFRNGKLVFAMGGHGTFDTYTVQNTQAAQVANVTLTGSAVTPFQDVATVVPAAIYQLPGSYKRLVLDAGTAPGIRLADAAAPGNSVLAPLPSLMGGASRGGFVTWVATVSGATVVQGLRTTPAGSTLTNLYTLSAAATPERIATNAESSVVAVQWKSGASSGILILDPVQSTAHNVTLRGLSVVALQIDGAGNVKCGVSSGTRERVLVYNKFGQPVMGTPQAATSLILK